VGIRPPVRLTPSGVRSPARPGQAGLVPQRHPGRKGRVPLAGYEGSGWRMSNTEQGSRECRQCQHQSVLTSVEIISNREWGASEKAPPLRCAQRRGTRQTFSVAEVVPALATSLREWRCFHRSDDQEDKARRRGILRLRGDSSAERGRGERRVASALRMTRLSSAGTGESAPLEIIARKYLEKKERPIPVGNRALFLRFCVGRCWGNLRVPGLSLALHGTPRRTADGIGLVHAAHAAAGATGAGAHGLLIVFLDFGHQSFGGEHQGGDGSGVLQGEARDLRGVNHAGLD